MLKLKVKIIRMISIEQKKFRFIEKYVKLMDAELIDKLGKMLEDEQANNEIFEVSDDLKLAIDEGITAIELNKGVPHKQVMEERSKKYPSLNF